MSSAHRPRARHAAALLTGGVVAAVALGLVGCSVDDGRRARISEDPLLLAAAKGPMLALFAQLDPRVVRFDPATGKAKRTLWLDDVYPEVTVVRGAAADRRHVYLLLGRRQNESDARLFILPHGKAGAARTIRLAPQPNLLAWGFGRTLLAGHRTAASGPLGRLSVIDVGAAKVLRTVALAGAALALAPIHKTRVAVLERAQLDLGGGDPLPRDSLAIVDTSRGKVLRRRALPAGGRHVVRGPTGLLYVSFASGAGTHETDGSVAAIDPRTLATVDRLRLQMIVRSMRATPRFLLLNMLSREGAAWFGVVDRAHRTTFDFEFNALVGSDIGLVGVRAYVPRRSSNTLAVIDLSKKKVHGDDLRVGGALPYKQRVTRLLDTREARRAR